jgi:N4-gp56 family major capsid protein
MAQISIGTLTDLEKSEYVKEGLKFAEYNLIYRQFGQKEDVKERAGKTRQWFRFSVPAVTSGSDFSGAATYVSNTTGSTPTFTPATPSTTTVTATADYLFGKGHEWTGSAEYSSFADIKSELRRVNAEHAGRAIDTEVRGTVIAGTTVGYANGKASRGLLSSADTIDMNDIFDSVTTLRNNSARPIKGMFRALHSHNVTAQLMKDAAFQAAIANQKDYIFKGTIAELYGVGFVGTENAPTVSNSGTNNTVSTVEQTLIVGEGAYGVTYWGMNDYDLIYTAPGGWGDEWKSRHALTWKYSGKAVILNQSWMLRLESARA